MSVDQDVSRAPLECRVSAEEVWKSHLFRACCGGGENTYRTGWVGTREVDWTRARVGDDRQAVASQLANTAGSVDEVVTFSTRMKLVRDE